MEEVTLQLTLDEVNKVLAALGNLPYLKVTELIDKVRAQGNAQLNAAASAENTDKNDGDVEQ